MKIDSPKGQAVKLSLMASLWFLMTLAGQGQSPQGGVPPIMMVRAEESYAFLRHNDSTQFFLRSLKFIPLNKAQSIYLTVGGEFRPRGEYVINENYTPFDRTDYTQRLSFHSALVLGDHFRLFGEWYHGYTTANSGLFQNDPLDLHQGFVEWSSTRGRAVEATIRVGRQELGLGSNRLVGIREGTNMRRAFDMARLIMRIKGVKWNVLYGKEIAISPSAFDNSANFADPSIGNPSLWGTYLAFPLNKIGKLDLYYLGFYSPGSTYANAQGEEMRHSLGIRSYGTKEKLTYNTELIVQVGTLAENSIFAYNFETDWTYELWPTHWQPTLGLKLDWSSGDAVAGDEQLGTFNPIFVNPAIYSLAAINTPANMISLHPSVSITPIKKLSIYVDYAFFYRTQAADGLYLPPRFLFREAKGKTERHIGDVVGLQAVYQAHRNVTISLVGSFFIAGRFIEVTGSSENILFIAPTLNLKL